MFESVDIMNDVVYSVTWVLYTVLHEYCVQCCESIVYNVTWVLGNDCLRFVYLL